MTDRKMRKMYGCHLSLSILIAFSFEIGSNLALPTNDHILYNTSTTEVPALNNTTQTTLYSYSNSTFTTAAVEYTTPDHGTCDNLGYVYNIGYEAYYNWYIWYEYGNWYNTSFWGGHIQIPWRENFGKGCAKWRYSYFAVLKEKHVDMSDIGEDVMTFDVCIWNETEECIGNFTVEMRKCNGHLLYRLPVEYYDNTIYYDINVCFDRIYTDSCQSHDYVYSAGNFTDKILSLFYNDFQYGWLDAYQNGKQYVVPSFDDVEGVYEECNNINGYRHHYFLKEKMVQDIPENGLVKLQACDVYKYDDYYDYNVDEDYHYNDEYCDIYFYARNCDGKIQFDVSFLKWNHYQEMCLIHYNDVKVVPEIAHTEDTLSDGTVVYRPSIQYRCSFEMTDSIEYNVNWYINGTLWGATGPSTDPDDLVLRGDALTQLRLGYQVKCGVQSSGVSEEKKSDDFYAGWKISHTSIKLPKNGYAIIEVEQTVPIGCTYTKDGLESCEETLSLLDINREIDVCKAGIHVMNADDNNTSFHTIKTLKVGDIWNSTRKYRFRMTTIDHDYDDKLNFNMELLVTKSEENEGVENVERIGIVGVEVTHWNIHRYKRCYSHADPHVRTADGRYFGQQKVGDHMLYRNKAYQTEVHEYARYCNGDSSGGPVCACGVTVVVGADVFVINRCGDYTILDFLQCNDGGIIEVQRIHDYRYKVITPIGTVVIINLHSWGRTMDIDIYLSAKDFQNTDGLCGYFDGYNSNDFRHRDGSQSPTSNGYYGYTTFIESWRLLDEENFLYDANRTLENWNVNNGATSDQACSDQNSISRNKCQFEKQNRRRRDVTNHLRRESTRKEIKSSYDNMRAKRSTESDITEDEAKTLCNKSISDTPAVREFSDQLAEENTDIVFDQCVYDIVNGKNTVWASAHVDALNSIATTVISLSPAFASNNSESVKTFLSQTCTNNCNGHGICSESGLCNCDGVYRGPDCSIDLTIPPIIYDINDGGTCDTSDGNECDCFVIRTDNIFDGFTYEIRTFELMSNGTKTLVDKSVHEGEYEDIFTGECCVTNKRSKRSTEEGSDTFVMMYDFAISNDGEHFGKSRSVHVYDSTCINYDIAGDVVTIALKNNFCYIIGSCVEQDTTLQTSSDCFVCSAKVNPYGWTKVSCNDDEIGLSSTALIGIIIGSVLVGILVTVAVVYVRCYKIPKKQRTVCVDGINSSQAYLSSGSAGDNWGGKP